MVFLSLSRSLDNYLQNIEPFLNIPPRRAILQLIKVTHSLGYRYLWMDGLDLAGPPKCVSFNGNITYALLCTIILYRLGICISIFTISRRADRQKDPVVHTIIDLQPPPPRVFPLGELFGPVYRAPPAAGRRLRGLFVCLPNRI